MRISDWSSDVCSSDLERQVCRARSPMSHDIAKANTPSPAASNSHGSQSAAPGTTDRSRAKPVPTAAIVPAATVIGTRKRRQCSQRSEEHTSELQALMRNSYAVFCLKKKKRKQT